MKKSKLTGTLAVGGSLKHAVVPYIITGEENNGYSKGDILDANYVKQLINNNTIPSNISADTLTLHSGMTFNDNINNYMLVNKDYFNLSTDHINISGVNNGYASLDAKLRYMHIGFDYSDIYVGSDVVLLGDTLLLFGHGSFQIHYVDNNDAGFYLNKKFVEIYGTDARITANFLEMAGHNNSGLIQYYSKDYCGYYKEGDVAFDWEAGNLFLNKIYKPTQTISEKDLFERVSDLEAPKITREDDPKVGQCVFDTALGKPIWCKTAKTDTTAAVWVDATGTTV